MSGAGDPQRPIRIAIVVPSLTGGGAEFVAVQWARFLDRSGHRVTLVTTHDPDATADGLNVVALRSASFTARARDLRRHVDAAGYDVLLGLMPHWNLLVLLARLGRRTGPAVLISGRNVEAPLRRVHGRAYRIELALARLLYRRADGYVAISHPVAAEAAGHYGLDPARVWVVPNPATAKQPVDRGRRRRDSVGTAGSVTLTVPARLVRQKHPEVAIETAAVLRDRFGLHASVAYFGHGPEEHHIRRTAERLAVPVTFHGWVTAWFDDAADDAVVLLPSVAEGFANVLVEAAAAGIPSVASSQALGVADAIVPQVTGMFAMDTTAEAFADAVDRARHLEPALAGAWFERFSPEESGAKLLHVLHAVLGRTPVTTTSTPAVTTAV